MATLETPLVAAINRVLEAEGWARERLAPFAGEALELRAPPLPALRFSIVEVLLISRLVRSRLRGQSIEATAGELHDYAKHQAAEP